jgi:nitrogen fixation NifU-like protein
MKDDLYQQAIIELAKRAREIPRLSDPDRTATVDNPLCGDRVTLDLSLDGDEVEEFGHKTRGCLLCEAASGLIAHHALRQSIKSLKEKAEDVVAKSFQSDEVALDELWPGLQTLAPVRHYKSRHECVTLPFQALIKALKDV